MSVSIRPLHPVFAGEVSGVDCRKPLTADEVAAIEVGMNLMPCWSFVTRT
jgi:alpha-ketoglutarate-dependent 2,4-dichlorophenoxyacetate dioxygenase